jgi:hypothetical protein
VLVEAGVYHESLLAPAFPFVLKGNDGQPIIDPSPLLGSDTLPCLVIPSSGSATIEDFRFRNGPEMYPRGGGNTGGIRTFGDSLVLRRCEFDSVFQGILRGDIFISTALVLEQCRFVSSQAGCLLLPFSTVEATDCLFNGANDYLVVCDSMQFDRCELGGATTGYLLLGFGGGSIRNCLFGPHGRSVFQSVHLLSFFGVFENNIFTHCAANHQVLLIQMPCHGESLRVSNNLFTDNTGGYATCLTIACDSMVFETPVVDVTENTVQYSRASDGEGRGLFTIVPGKFSRNRFHHLEPDTPAAIRSYHSNGVMFRENMIWQTGLAAALDRADPDPLDMRWNWWGDETGPYHPQLNPLGRGDTVGDNILFIPWYPDTSFLALEREPRELPAEFTMATFPNPFNSTLTIRLFAPDAEIVRVELFDILGRQVQTIWSGPVIYEQRVSFAAGDLPSGLYFVRAWLPMERRVAAAAKVVLIK